MNNRWRRRWLVLKAAITAMIAAFALSGCGSGDSGGEPSAVETFTGKVAYIGNLKGTLSGEMDKVFVNSIPFDGKSVNMPILIAADSVPSLTPEQIRGVRSAFDSHQPVVLVHGSASHINSLLGILGLNQNFILPDGLPQDKQYAELFAVDQEPDGYIFTWAMYPPREGAAASAENGAPVATEDIDTDSDQLARVQLFHTWMDDDGERVTEQVKAYREEATKALAAGVKADNGELTQLAKAFVVTQNFSYQGNNYQLSYYIYSCHSFNVADATDYDWFYVRQEGILNASGAYGGVKSWYGGGPSDEVHYFIGNYRMNNWLDGLASPGSGVTLMRTAPENANNVAQVTSGISWNIGGSVGFQGTQATGALNAGVTISNSTTVNVSDCEVVNNSTDNINNARWRYEFKKPAQTVYYAYTGLQEPPLLSRSTFQPVNHWIWKFSPAIRNANKSSFSSQFDVDLIWSVGGQSYAWWIADSAKHYTYYGGSWSFQVPLSFPPLLVAPRNLDFNAAGDHKTMDLTVSRSWTASSNQPWCQVEPAGGTADNTRVNITVDQNTSGASRTPVITFKTADGKGSDTTTVFQAKN